MKSLLDDTAMATSSLVIDRTRDRLFTAFGKATLDDRYLLPGESYQDLYARVAMAYGDDPEHAQRLYDYMSKHWFSPATPILSNAGSDRGMPISCFLDDCEDNMESIVDMWVENIWLAHGGGGLGTYMGEIRGIGEQIGKKGKSSGIIPFIRVMDSLTLAVAQGSLRKGSAAVYLPIWHPEIEEFIEMRRPTGGDPNRKALNLHHGVVIPDAFYMAVENDEEWALRSPKDNSIIRMVSARGLWIRILTARMEQGEPYILNIDTINEMRPELLKKNNLEVKTSNLCVAPETVILTPEGYKTIAQLADTDQMVWTGTKWAPAHVACTNRDSSLIEVTLSNGVTLSVTPYHRFLLHNDEIVEAQSLKAHHVLKPANLPVLGTRTKDHPFDPTIYSDGVNRGEFRLDMTQWSLDDRLIWLSGKLDACGSRFGNAIVFYERTREQARLARLFLTTLGIDAIVQPRVMGETMIYGVRIDAHGIRTLASLSFVSKNLSLQVEETAGLTPVPVSVVSVVDKGRRDATYCFNEPETHRGVFEGVLTMNCAEITLPVGRDHHQKKRTAVCCLSSMNLDTWNEWHDNDQIIPDVMRMLDNVLSDFIKRGTDKTKDAVYAALRERSVGLGVMGFHSFLQQKRIPFGSVMAKVWNKKIFKHIRAQCDQASHDLAVEKGPCLDAQEHGIMERFTHKMAIAPTASISIICGNTSPGIEPWNGNVFLQKTQSGSFTVKNKYLKEVLHEYGRDTDEVWSSITLNKGSVQHLDFLSDDDKDVFKTAFEIDQRWIIEHAGDRQPFVCQAQSVNLFLPADIHKRDLHQIHMLAWKRKLKSLYYCRSLSIQRADTVSLTLDSQTAPVETTKYEECLACS